VAVAVAVGVNVAVGVGVNVAVAVGVGVKVAVAVAVGVGVGVGQGTALYRTFTPGTSVAVPQEKAFTGPVQLACTPLVSSRPLSEVIP